MKYKVGDYVKIIKDIETLVSEPPTDYVGKIFRIDSVANKAYPYDTEDERGDLEFISWCDEELEPATKEEYEQSLIEEQI